MIPQWKIFFWWVLAQIKSVLQWLPFMNKSFIILSSGRSGSTLLRILLNCHYSVNCWGELLNREKLEEHGLKKASNEVLINYILARLLPFKLWLPYTGFKLFNEQVEYCQLSLKTLLSSLYSPPVIILYRENLLETYVSLKIAEQNQIWYSETVVNECSIEVDWEEFKEYCETERKRWQESLSELSGSQKLFVSFEDLIANQDETMNKIFDFLKIKPFPVKASSKRQNPQMLEEKVSNYEEITALTKKENYSTRLTLEWLKAFVLN